MLAFRIVPDHVTIRRSAPVAQNDRGVALVIVLLITTLVFAMGVGVALLVASETLAASHYRQSLGMLYAADAGIELAARELAATTDWNAVLSGRATAVSIDGPASGVKTLPDGAMLDLDAETALLNCGVRSGCTTAQLWAVTRDRPWGVNNPRWRPFLYGPVSSLHPFTRPHPYYVVVWIADDARESDGDPEVDGGGDPPRGAGVVRVRADAFGPLRARRALEGELARVCRPAASGERCLPGVRVQSWRELRQAVP